ncbi:hypothetical protein E2I00_009059, partial [Balaenoptera physalus]
GRRFRGDSAAVKYSSDKRQQALGSVDEPKENWICHLSRCSIWGLSKRYSGDSAVSSSELVTRLNQSVSFTFFPLYYFISTEACPQPNTSSESKAKSDDVATTMMEQSMEKFHWVGRVATYMTELADACQSLLRKFWVAGTHRGIFDLLLPQMTED